MRPELIFGRDRFRAGKACGLNLGYSILGHSGHACQERRNSTATDGDIEENVSGRGQYCSPSRLRGDIKP